MPKIQFALALVGPSDELLVRVFDSEESLRQFAALNPPAPVEGRKRVTRGPLSDACTIRGLGPTRPFGYGATKLEDGVPVDFVNVYWGHTGRDGVFVPEEGFDPSVPLFHQPESAV